MEATNETGKNPAGAQSSAKGATLSGGLGRDWYITNIRRGNGNREKYIYADLRDGNDELMISATLEYIVSSIEDMTKRPNETK